ncbi:MAG: cyclophilin-like fold protein [Candidatus Ornithomonoglobus sp.]
MCENHHEKNSINFTDIDSINVNGTREYESGGLAYWHEDPSIAIFYDHNFDKTVVPVITIGKILNGQESFFENYSGEITITKR